MQILKVFRIFVLLISFVMFFYQLNTATVNLMDPPTVLSQYEREAFDDDMPLITVCPTNQTNLIRLTEVEHYEYDWMLWGLAKCNETTWCTSWGAQVNLTFDELKGQVFDLDKVGTIDILRKGGEVFNSSLVFIPGYGICKETELLNYTQEILVEHWNPDESRVFLTDRNYRSFIMVDTASHIGKEIFIKPESNHFINVKIQEINNCKDDENPMSEKEFTKCVDDKIHKEFEQNNISCIPPWLSDNKQCNKTYKEEFFGKFEREFEDNYLFMVGILSNIRFEEECRQSCKETTYVVNEKGSKKPV